ncbi:Calcium-binding protein [Nostoc sp. DSM 114161]|jgi:Ca2+-binding RTX toxin-like protein|uniref:beta strand repeat-containing protein n=1 Tax=Nostoc sp. DSM 114161 TaxID=3440143 RepID=UPI0040467723
MSNIIGTNGNDTLVGTFSADTINGKAGNDTITGDEGNDTLTGGGGKDTFVYNDNKGFIVRVTDGIDTITDFGGVGKGTNPTAATIAEVDTINFYGSDLTARNLILTQNSNDLEITFEGNYDTKLILQNFKLEDLDNLKASGTRPAIGNIIFDGETSISDSFNVLDANSTDTTIGIANTVTFFNDLDNNITALDNSDDVINGQGGNDKINGLSGNDLLRGGAGNDTLIGAVGNDILVEVSGNNSLVGGIGDDALNVRFSTGNNTLDGGAGKDTLNAQASKGNNLLFGGDGNDYLDASFFLDAEPYTGVYNYTSSLSNNTLNGGAGDDILLAESSTGNNLLSSGDGNDYLSISGYTIGTRSGEFLYFGTSGDNTLNGGAGNDTLYGEYLTGDNLLSGGDGNDSFYVNILPPDIAPSSLATQTIDGGQDDDFLSIDYSNAKGGITSTFNATTNQGVITAGNYRVSYKNIERLNIIGTAYDDKIVGSNGNDTLSVGSSGKDTIDGGKGDDLLTVDYSNANAGIASTFNATANTGSITAGSYRVSYKNIERLNISGTAYNDNIVGSNGNDTLSVGSGGKDTIDGGKGDDLLRVDYSNANAGITSTFNATANTGSITAGSYRVSYKNIERLNISGTGYSDDIVGSNGNDTLSVGSGGKDTIDGGKGDDLLSVDYRFGEKGITSTFNATANKGEITGGGEIPGSTSEVSYRNIERLNVLGTDYDDYIVGSNGNDTLSGGYQSRGNDTLVGGAGNDTFVLDISTSVDNISDFNPTNELIQVSAFYDSGLSPGVLKANQFVIGASATTSSQQLIYNSTTGGLFFDQDGSGSKFTQFQFALLTTGLALTNNNFVVA